MAWSSLRWLVEAIEAAAVIALLLCVGAAIAVAAFWLLSRTARMLSGNEPQDPDGYDEPIVPSGDPDYDPQQSKHPPSPC